MGTTALPPMIAPTLTVGAMVRPFSEGEDSAGRTLHWARLRGRVVDLWDDCGELRAEVRWQRQSPYPTRLPAYMLALV